MNELNLRVRVRPATVADLSFVLAQVHRLVEFELPPWRTAEAICATTKQLLQEAITAPPAGSTVLIAEREGGEALGFVHLETAHDFFSGDVQGYVANLAVASSGEGQGVGRALMSAAEAWTKAQGMRYLALYVFARNTRARAFYTQLGFVEDSLKVVKEV